MLDNKGITMSRRDTHKLISNTILYSEGLLERDPTLLDGYCAPGISNL